MSSRSDGFGGDVQLDVISVAVKMETMAVDDVTKGEHVEDECLQDFILWSLGVCQGAECVKVTVLVMMGAS